MTDPIMLGLPRSYFYARIAEAMHAVIDRESILGSSEHQEMVMKVNIQDALGRLLLCPVCGHKLSTLDNYPQERSCECGDFTVTEVWSDGDVVFEFKMLAPEKIEEDGPDVDHDEGD